MATKTKTPRVTKRLLKVRELNAKSTSVRTQNPHVRLLATAMFEKKVRSYVTDKQGRQVVVNDANGPTKDDVRHFLIGQRVVTMEDMLYELGEGWIGYMIKDGRLVKDAVADYYWVTERGAEVYNLPPVRVQGVLCKFKKAA